CSAPGLEPLKMGADTSRKPRKLNSVCAWLGVFKLGAEARMVQKC
ncbi:hypothetical protein A2U01_0084299, partial [Trifolium medium]|nr:hypothetical protein [Trifolium medium]